MFSTPFFTCSFFCIKQCFPYWQGNGPKGSSIPILVRSEYKAKAFYEPIHFVLRWSKAHENAFTKRYLNFCCNKNRGVIFEYAEGKGEITGRQEPLLWYQSVYPLSLARRLQRKRI